MIEPKCKNCRYWKSYDSCREEPFGEAQGCNNPKFKFGYFCYEEIMAFASDEIVIENDEGWAVHPGPDFGCIHFSEK